jgi:hypothetical protein
MINLEQYDFVDIGCATMGSAAFLSKLGLKSGVGVSNDAARVKKAAAGGHAAVQLDPADLESFKGKTKICFISQHIERLESFADARKTLAAAVHVSRQAVFVRMPWFDSDGPNLKAGVKMFWSDWKAHTLPLTSLHFHRALAPLIGKNSIARFVILGYRPITDSGDDSVLPLAAERDSQKYDVRKHGEKAVFPLPVPTFTEIFVLVARQNPASLEKMIAALGDVTMIYDTDNQSAAPAAPSIAHTAETISPEAKQPAPAPATVLRAPSGLSRPSQRGSTRPFEKR